MVDLLAGGRLILGFGGGWVEREFDAFGVDRSRRGALLEEKLPRLRRALAEGALDDGPDGTDLPVGPCSPQPGGPPLYLGGTAPRALDRVARLADGWFALAHFRWQKTAEAGRRWPRPWSRPAGGRRFPVVVGVHRVATTRSAPGPPSWPRPSPTSSTATATGPPTATSRAPTRSTPAGSSGRRPSATPPRGSWRLTEFQERLPFTHVSLWSRPRHQPRGPPARTWSGWREVAPAFAGPEPPGGPRRPRHRPADPGRRSRRNAVRLVSFEGGFGRVEDDKECCQWARRWSTGWPSGPRPWPPAPRPWPRCGCWPRCRGRARSSASASTTATTPARPARPSRGAGAVLQVRQLGGRPGC